jgi:hypothetical protein
VIGLNTQLGGGICAIGGLTKVVQLRGSVHSHAVRRPEGSQVPAHFNFPLPIAAPKALIVGSSFSAHFAHILKGGIGRIKGGY